MATDLGEGKVEGFKGSVRSVSEIAKEVGREDEQEGEGGEWTTVEMQVLSVRVVDENEIPSEEEWEYDKTDLFGPTSLPSLSSESERRRRDCHWTSSQTVVLVFGVTSTGASVLVRVNGFWPFLYYLRPSDQGEVESSLRLPPSHTRAELVTRTNFYGWEPDATQALSPSVPLLERGRKRATKQYTKLSFATRNAYERAARLHHPVCHESMIDAETKFCDEHDIVLSGWIRVRGKVPSSPLSSCKHELTCSSGRGGRAGITPLPSKSEIAPLLCCFFDIECISETDRFPDASQVGDRIVQIGVHFWRVGSPREESARVLLTLGECDPIDGVRIDRCSSESSLLTRFRELVTVEADPDVFLTYNGSGFDWRYLVDRSLLLGAKDFLFLGRIPLLPARTREKKLASSALGSNDLFLVDCEGRYHIDLFQYVKAGTKLRSYKLDSVAEHFLGERKVDLPPKELFRLAREGKGGGMATVGRYCDQDVALLVSLVIHLKVFFNRVEMSRVCRTSLDALETRGQQVKVFNQLSWYGHRLGRDESTGQGGFLLNTPSSFVGKATDSYEGGCVLDPETAYYTEPIAVLDYMSLYPSVIIANNFCPSTLVLDQCRFQSSHRCEGVTYTTVDVDPEKGQTYTFVDVPGVLPQLLKELLKARKQAKRDMADAKDADERSVLNARQLQIKVAANSVYGFTGAIKSGRYPCLAVAASTTFRAREYLFFAKSEVLRWSEETRGKPCRVVYGDTDSVMVHFGVSSNEEAYALGEAAADFITNRFKERGLPNLVLEMEKTYLPYLLMGKKKYAGLMYEDRKEKGIDAKGIEMVRRDNCLFAKKLQTGVVHALMHDMSPEKAISILQDELGRLMRDEVDLEDYVISKARRDGYKNENLPHLAVVQKMESRAPGSAPQCGDRVRYIYVEARKNATKEEAKRGFERAEDPGFVLSQRALSLNDPVSFPPSSVPKIDRLYYLEHQVVEPMTRVLELIVSTDRLFLPVRNFFRGQTMLPFQTRPSSVLPSGSGSSSSERPSSSSSSSFQIDLLSLSKTAGPSKPKPKKRKAADPSTQQKSLFKMGVVGTKGG